MADAREIIPVSTASLVGRPDASPGIGPRVAMRGTRSTAPASSRSARTPISSRPRSRPGGDPAVAGSPRCATIMTIIGAYIVSNPPSDPGRLLAGPHNARLGSAIHAFNLPAGPDVRIGATPTCATACYAKGFLFQIQGGGIAATASGPSGLTSSAQ